MVTLQKLKDQNIQCFLEVENVLLAELSIALTFGFLETNRNGIFHLLFLFQFGTVISGMRIILSSTANLTDMSSQDWTDKLTGCWITQHMTPIQTASFAIISAEFAFSTRTWSKCCWRGQTWSKSCRRGRSVSKGRRDRLSSSGIV